MSRLETFWRRWGAWILLAVLAASLAPILLLGRYDWASADDFTYAIYPHLALRHGGSVLGAVWFTMWDYYKSWQGSFMSLFLMSLTPLTFSEYAYWLTPVVMLGSLCLGTFKLADTLVRRCLGGGWRQTVYVAAPILLLSIQCVASPRDTFFWWNGAVYYTFTYGIMLLLVERFVALSRAKSTGQRLWAVLPALPAAILVGGSNYVSALLATLVSLLFLLYFLLRDRKKLPWAIPPALVLWLCFAASILAPGNRGRQSTITEPMGPAGAVLASILKAGKDCLEWPSWPVVLVLLLLIPTLWGLTARVKFRFPLPLGFSAFTFLLFAAQNAPHFYAVSTSGPERLRSIVFYSFFWLAVINLWYWLGWLRRAFPRLAEGKGLARCGRAGAVIVLAALAFTTLWFHYLPGFTSVQCGAALADGSAAAYFAEQEARLPQLLDPEVREVWLEPIQNRPPLLYNEDVTANPADWQSNVVRMFYEKDSVALISQGG